MLPYCGANGALAPPLCNPATSGGGGLVIDASILGLNQSFIMNNYDTGNNEGQLTIYGSIQQDARGPVAELGGGGSVTNGYGKTYTSGSTIGPLLTALLLDSGHSVVGSHLVGGELLRGRTSRAAASIDSVVRPTGMARRLWDHPEWLGGRFASLR